MGSSRGHALVNALVFSLVVVGLLVGCKSDCQTDADCGAGQSCVYPTSDGCSAKGKCEDSSPSPNCNLEVQYCGCDGSTVSVSCGLSGGSEPVAGLYGNGCGHGTKAVGSSCVNTADCGLYQGCYYPIAAGCSAAGVCLENMTDAASGCESAPLYCTCDGGRAVSECDGHYGYVEAPVSRSVSQEAACSMPDIDGGPILVPASDGGAQ
jgi:hypothetical protein